MNRSRSHLCRWGIVCLMLAVVGCDLMKKEPPPAPAPQPQPPPVAPVEKKPVAPAPATPPPAKEAVKETVKEVVKAVEAPKMDPAKQAALPPDLLQIKGEIAQAKAQVDMTMAKLEVLAASTGDLEKPSEEATAAIQALGTSTAALKSRADDMRQRGAAYFEAWEKQLQATTTPAVAAIISKRKDELAQKYSDVLTTMQQTRAAYDPLWSSLDATAKSIEDGLNPDKVKLFGTNALPKLKEQAKTFKDRVDTVASKLDQVAVIYTSP